MSRSSWQIWITLVVGLLPLTTGCQRQHYRARADRDVTAILAERAIDSRWAVPGRPVEAAPFSRMADPTNPDKPPIPPDDPSARLFQVTADKPFEYFGWNRRGWLGDVENAHWQASLILDEDGNVLLDQASAMELGLLHSRDYQNRVEDVYLSALDLTSERFAFETQWGSGHDVNFQHRGSGDTEANTLSVLNGASARRALLSGGQVLVDFANSLVFEFRGTNFQSASSNLVVAMTQPLLRGAFARIRTQPLSQAERGVLYALRDFARFRRQFYVDLVGGSGFLGLLLQVQAIRNLESNLETLRRNLDEHEELSRAGLIAPIQRDQVFQQFQQVQFSLLTARASLESSLDNYKRQLGLPPELPVRLDDSLLRRFELTNPEFDAIQARNDALYLSLLQFDGAPSFAILRNALLQLEKEQAHLAELVTGVLKQHESWKNRLRLRQEAANLTADDRDNLERELALMKSVDKALAEAAADLKNDNARTIRLRDTLEQLPPAEAWKAVRDMVGSEFRGSVSEAFVSEAMIRVFLIDLGPVDLTLEEASTLALENRLDLMNSLALVTDAWRNVEVAADQLQADLNVSYRGSLASDPTQSGTVRLDASESSHQLGVALDTPLNRLQERNRYRASQILYQRARRNYMATRDQVIQEIRLDLRNLDQARRQFEIGREQLVTAARQVDEAQFNLRTSRQADSSVTQDLLNALQSLLAAKNSLVSTWVQYETARMSLFRDLDLMNVDEQGVWTDDRPQHPLSRTGTEAGLDAAAGAETKGLENLSEVR